MSDILTMLNDENAKRVAEDLIVAIEEKGNKDTLDFDFRVKNGIMERKKISNPDILKALIELHGKEVPEPNTWFSFDTNLKSMLGYLKDTICNKLEDQTISDKEFNAIQPFLKKVISIVNNDEVFLNRLRNALRKVVLNGGDEVLFPLKECKLILFEFGSKEDYGDIIKISNYRRVNKITGQFVGEKSSISKDLMEKRRAYGFERGQDTKAIYSKIIEQERQNGNQLYAGVLPEDVEVVTEAKECHLDIFADYAPIDKESLVSKLVEASANVDQK